MADDKRTSDLPSGTPTLASVLAFLEGGVDYQATLAALLGIVWQPPIGMRLSLSSNTYVPSGDVTGASTLYWTPVISGGSGIVSGYNGSAIARKLVTQKSLALTSLTSGKNYNVYYDYDGDALVLGAAWTGDTTPSETIADESGAPVLSTDHTKLYLGVIRTTGTTTTEDSAAKRFVWNRFNQTPRVMKAATETTDSWPYTLAAFRRANNNTANQLEYVTGAAETFVEANVSMLASHTASTNVAVGIGVDSATVNSAPFHGATAVSTSVLPITARYSGMPGIGYHFLAQLEYSTASGTTTWYGDAGNATIFQTGISGTIWN